MLIPTLWSTDISILEWTMNFLMFGAQQASLYLNVAASHMLSRVFKSLTVPYQLSAFCFMFSEICIGATVKSHQTQPDITLLRKLKNKDWLGSILNATAYTFFVMVFALAGIK